MKLGRFVLEGLDGPVQRICLVLAEERRVIDLRAAEALRQQGRGASREAALRYASTVFPSSMSAAIALGAQFLETADAATAAASHSAASAALPGAKLIRLASDLASQPPPVDAARVASLRAAIAEGTYTTDAKNIALAMLSYAQGRAD